MAQTLTQMAGDTNKLYTLHAPDLKCIAKGKARVRYEFGVKTSIAVTNARTAGSKCIVGMQALPGNPHGSHKVSGQIGHVEHLTGVTFERAYVYRGCKRHKHGGKAKVYIAHTLAASLHPRSNANPGAGTPWSRSSATPNPVACWNVITLPVPPVMRSTPSWSPPDIF
jgi:hypothetical protein